MGFYGFGETLHNMISLIYTKVFWRSGRLIRLPFYARNKKNIILSGDFTCGYNCRVVGGAYDRKVFIGKNFIMGDNCQLEGHGGITIGHNVLMASRVFIGTTSHGSYSGENHVSPKVSPNERDIIYEEVIIGDNVWIGNGVSILSGVHIGQGSIIGAGAVVTKDIPDKCIAAGNPARVIKRYNETECRWIKSVQQDDD